MNEQQLMQQIGQALTPDNSPSPVPMIGAPVEVIEHVELQSDKPVRMTDDEITAILDRNILAAQNWVGSTVMTDQAQAMEYYLGVADGDLAPPGVEDRSSVVDTVVSDQIEWLMPSLMEIFYASGKPVKFTPRKPGDEDAAEQMTALCNYVLNEQNDGFRIFADWFKTALLSKVGVVKVWWEEETDVTQEAYTGLDDAQIAILTSDPGVKIVELVSYTDPFAEQAAMQQYTQGMQAWNSGQPQQQYQMAMQQMRGLPPGSGPQGVPPPPQPPQPVDVTQLPQLHDVTLNRSEKAGHICVEALNPEDFILSQNSRQIKDGFCAHRFKKSLSELKAEGYKNVDDIDSEANAETVGMAALPLARESLQDAFVENEADYGDGDESQRIVWLYECYLPIDCDGDGIAEWRKILKSGSQILENEICDEPPFASLCPVPIPGLFYGRSIADLAMPIQRIKTGVLRGMIDNMQLQINGRTIVNEKKVNMDDLLTNRPGGVVRVDDMGAVAPLQQGMTDMTGAMSLLQYVDSMSQERTGITKYSQGLDSDTLNHTATGIENITQRADLRVKLIARTFAETGVKSLFRLIQKLLAAYQDRNMTFQLEGKWVDVDPRVWKNQYSMSVTVGTGTGDTTRRVNQLQQLAAVQMAALQSPNPTIQSTVTPQNIFNTQRELVQALQLGDPAQFFSPPQAPPPQPPQPDPQMMAIQGQMQLEHQKAQDDKDLQLLKIQTQAALDKGKSQNDAAVEQHKAALIDARERDIAAQQQALDWQKFLITQETSRINAALMAKATPEQESALDSSVGNDLNS